MIKEYKYAAVSPHQKISCPLILILVTEALHFFYFQNNTAIEFGNEIIAICSYR